MTSAATVISLAFLASLALPPAGKAFAQSTAAAKPSAAALLELDDGRKGKGNLIATTGVRGISKGSAYALIMTIGDYPNPVSKLPGVGKDAETASKIALRMGIPPERIRALKDDQLTLEGMRAALDELDSKLSGNDQVFVYYSGHGGRQLIKEYGEERCAESLITHDKQGMVDNELETRLRRIAGKAQKTIVLVDACHSGGVTTRSVGSSAVANSQAAFVAKSYIPPGQACDKPVNVLTRNLSIKSAPGTGSQNFLHIAAARDNEISLDQPGKGGVASQAWLACISGDARDLDGSGGLSGDEIRTCAQEKINQMLRNAPGFLPHNVTLNGNPNMVLAFSDNKETQSDVPATLTAPATPPAAAIPAAPPAPAKPVAVTPPPTLATTPTPTLAATPAPAVAVKPSSLAAMKDIYNSRDDRRLVTVTAAKTQLKIGKDIVDFSISSREGGYVYILMSGSDGKTFDLLFPNQIDKNNLLEAGASMKLPRPSWQLSAEGPPGRNTLLVLVSDAPRDFSAAGLVPSGPFSSVPANAAKDIQLITAAGNNPSAQECADINTRTLAVQKRCSTAYGAAVLTIDEVQ